MLKRTTRVLTALSFATIALAPLAASAQYSGTNGQIFFDYEANDANFTQSIAAMNPDGSEPHIVIQGSDNGTTYDKFQNVVANPAGTKIAYTETAGTYGGTTQPYKIDVANADGSNASTVYTAPTQTGNGYSIVSTVVFSSDGSHLFFTQNNDSVGTTNGIYTVATGGGSATQLITATASDQNASNGLVVTSSKLYYSTFDTSQNYKIKSANLDGTGAATLYSAGAGASHRLRVYDVAPDGSVVLFATSDGNGNDQLSSVDTATGTTVTPLTTLSGSNIAIAAASYSPDGAKIAFAYETDSGNTQTLHGGNVMNADGTGSVTVLRADADLFWSSTANASAGTYPNGLVLGLININGGSGGADPDLADAGGLRTSLPITLALAALVAAGGIETARRVRRHS